MKHLLYISLLLTFSISFAQKEDSRILTIKNQLEVLSEKNSQFTENVKTEINVDNITLSNFLLGLSNIHNININVNPELNNITIANNNFNGVSVADVLVYLCKEYDLTIAFTGNILSVKRYIKPQEEIIKREIPVDYNASKNTISIDLKGDNIYDAFKKIIDVSGKNLMFFPGLENKQLTSFIKEASFDAAMINLAQSNNLVVQKNKDGLYQFGAGSNSTNQNGTVNSQGNRSNLGGNSSFKILDLETKLLEVNFHNTPIYDIIRDLAIELNINIFTASPLENAGNTSFKAKSITFDDLLTKIFEAKAYSSSNNSNAVSDNSQNSRPSQRNQNLQTGQDEAVFTFKKENDIYYFGTEQQLSVRRVELIKLKYRSVRLLSEPSGNLINNNFGSNFNQPNRNSSNNNFNNLGNNTLRNQNGIQRGGFQNQNSRNNSFGFQSAQRESEDLLEIIPDDIKQDLEFKVDIELNSIYIAGANEKIERFKRFIEQIDKRIPMVLIEVMIIEVGKNATIEAGVTWGIEGNPVETQGDIFPETDLTLGARTVNRIIGSFNDFAGVNLGRVVPNFFATIRAMELNGDLKIRSTPKLTTLNGHRASFSNGTTSSFTVTDRSIIGTDNPLVNEIVNFIPIEAELGLNINPSITGEGEVILDINVVQSTFGPRITENGPPDLISRNFNSVIRMKDQDIAILGGLEEQSKVNSGSGVPFLSKVPILKWLFSNRRREASKTKLTVLIKPTIIY